MNLLESIIQRLSVEASGRPYPVDKVVLIVDPVTRKVDTRRPIWNKEKYRYYLVSPQVTENCPTTRFQIQNKEKGEMMTIAITFTVKVASGQEKELARKLSGDESPSRAFEKEIDGFNEEFVRKTLKDDIDPFEQFDAVYEDWGKYLVVRLRSELGLEATARVGLPGYTGAFEMSGDPAFVVHPSDSDDAVSLKYTVGVEPESLSERRPGGKYLPENQLREKLQLEVGRFIQQHMTLHDLSHEEESVKGGLRAHLAEFLVAYRLRVRFLKLQAEPDFGRNLPEGFSDSVECLVEPNETKVKVKHALRLTWLDVGKLRRKVSSRSDVEAYLKKVLEQATWGELRDKTYAQLVVGFDEYKAKIKESVDRRLKEVGCQVQQLVTLSDLEHAPLISDGFNFILDPREYPTSDGDVNFGLRVSFNGRFLIGKVSSEIEYYEEDGTPKYRIIGPDEARSKLLSVLKPGWNFKDAAEGAIRICVQQVLERRTPEELYLYFSQLEKKETEEAGENQGGQMEEPAKVVIEREIKKRLLDRFGANCGVTVTPVDTQVGTLYRALLSFPQQIIQFEITPQEATHEKLNCRLAYRVLGMARDTETNRTGWRSFQKRCHNPEAKSIIAEMTAFIEFQARRDLSILDLDKLKFLDIRQVREIEGKALQPTFLAVRNTFGLALEFTLDRDATTTESAVGEVTGVRLKAYVAESKADIESTQKQMKLLREKLEQSADLMPEEQEEIEKKLKGLKALLVEQTGEIERPRLSKPKPRRASNLNDYLLPENNGPQKSLPGEQKKSNNKS